MSKRSAKKRSPAERKTYAELYKSIEQRFAKRFSKKNQRIIELRRRVNELNGQLAILAKLAWKEVVEASESGDEFGEAMMACGLAAYEPFDPEVHVDVNFEFDPEPGEEVLLLTAAGEALLHPPVVPGEGF